MNPYTSSNGGDQRISMKSLKRRFVVKFPENALRTIIEKIPDESGRDEFLAIAKLLMELV